MLPEIVDGVNVTPVMFTLLFSVIWAEAVKAVNIDKSRLPVILQASILRAEIVPGVTSAAANVTPVNSGLFCN